MAITTYATLKTAVENWLDRTDLTARVPEWVSMAEDRIALDPRMRIRAMETAADITINSQEEALPTGFLESRRIYIDGNSKEHALEYMTPTNFWDSHGAGQTGRPIFYTIEGENYVFGPSPDATYTGKQLYYKRFTAFSADGDNNWLLLNARGVYLYGTLLEAAMYMDDDAAVAKWATMFDNAVDLIAASDKKDRHPSGPMVARSGIMGI